MGEQNGTHYRTILNMTAIKMVSRPGAIHEALSITDGDGGLIVSVGYDGQVTLGPGWTADDASKAFYEHFAEHIVKCAPQCANGRAAAAWKL